MKHPEYNYPVKLHLSYQDFIKEVKNISTCCAFMDGQYVSISEGIREKMKSGQLIINEYHDTPLGEVIYLSAESKSN